MPITPPVAAADPGQLSLSDPPRHLVQAAMIGIVAFLEANAGRWVPSRDFYALKTQPYWDVDGAVAAAMMELRAGGDVQVMRGELSDGTAVNVYRLADDVAPEDLSEFNPPMTARDRREWDKFTRTYENTAFTAFGRRVKMPTTFRAGRERRWVSEQRAKGIPLPIDPVPPPLRKEYRRRAHQELRENCKGRGPLAVDQRAVSIYKREQAERAAAAAEQGAAV